MTSDEQLVTEVLRAVAALQARLVHKVVELRGVFPDRTANAIEYEVDFFDNLARRAIRVSDEIPPSTHRANGSFEGVVISGSIDAELPDTEGVVWDITLERRGSGWVVHRWLYAYVAADKAEYIEGRRQIHMDFPDVEGPTSHALSVVLGQLTDELLGAHVPYLN